MGSKKMRKEESSDSRGAGVEARRKEERVATSANFRRLKNESLFFVSFYGVVKTDTTTL